MVDAVSIYDGRGWQSVEMTGVRKVDTLSIAQYQNLDSDAKAMRSPFNGSHGRNGQWGNMAGDR
jgi:hypothetical protein